jgi:hypothetical protein
VRGIYEVLDGSRYGQLLGVGSKGFVTVLADYANIIVEIRVY